MLWRALAIAGLLIGSLPCGRQRPTRPATPRSMSKSNGRRCSSTSQRVNPMRVGLGAANGLQRRASSIPAPPSGFAIFSISVRSHLADLFPFSRRTHRQWARHRSHAARARDDCRGCNDDSEGCIGRSEAVCRALKRSGTTFRARWRGINAGCNSSCVYALIGATVRHVPPGARVGIHTSKVPYIGEWERLFANAQLASFNLELHNYIHEMGINDDLYDEIQKVPFEQVRILTRNEIAISGIDTSRFQETPWTVVEASRTERASAIKLFTRAIGRAPGRIPQQPGTSELRRARTDQCPL